MEALSTYNTIQDIARKASGDYDRGSGNVEDYAQQVILLYRSEATANPIKDNVYYRYLLEEYSGTVKNEIVKMINSNISAGSYD